LPGFSIAAVNILEPPPIVVGELWNENVLQFSKDVRKLSLEQGA
jgi:hypothetical protein